MSPFPSSIAGNVTHPFSPSMLVPEGLGEMSQSQSGPVLHLHGLPDTYLAAALEPVRPLEGDQVLQHMLEANCFCYLEKTTLESTEAQRLAES
jgi:hypothetical protein